MQPVRGDHVAWFGGDEPACRFKALPVLLQRVDTLVSELAPHVPELRGVKNRTKAMVTCYPGGGARYVRHCDTTRGATHNGRILTAVYYANGGGWSLKDGGELRIFSPMNSTEDQVVERATLPPLGDRLVIFWSDNRVPHEVLAAHFQRFACTIWYFDERLRGAALDEASVGGGGGPGGPGGEGGDGDGGGRGSVVRDAGDGGGESSAAADAKEREHARIRREIARYEAKYGVKAKVYKDYDAEGASSVKTPPTTASGDTGCVAVSAGAANTESSSSVACNGLLVGIDEEGTTPTPAPRTPPPPRPPNSTGGDGTTRVSVTTRPKQADKATAAVATSANATLTAPHRSSIKLPSKTQFHKDWRGSADVWELD